jgi:hypothetical protein
MTALHLRSLNGNLNLAFIIGEHKLDPNELENFTLSELKQFLIRTTREDLKSKIEELLKPK